VIIYLGADHAGYAFKERAKRLLTKLDRNLSVIDLGNTKIDELDDYPRYADKVAKSVASDEDSLGLLFCGTGSGMCIAANKTKSIRAVSVSTVKEARLSREHNAANVLCLGQRVMTWRVARHIIKSWLETPTSYEARHLRRVRQLNRL
jgi:ribose 5-phosphate isomerase B